MVTDNLVLVEQLCLYYKIEFSFIDSLEAYGLINVVVIDDCKYLSNEDLGEIERLMRLHYDLGINMEGIDVISNLINQIAELQKELTVAKNKLNQLNIQL
ncbi:MAG: chaperone modulator CbpM [Cyclobacteriaceae bacterium]|nr:chaperone modulator CbpM [Cyclobacteriaceae bacterium]